MTEQTIAQSLTELVDLVAQGKPMDAFDKFYHPDLEKTDLDGVTVTGLAANYQQGLNLLNSITEIRDFSHKGTIVTGDRSFLVWHIDFDTNDGGTVNVTEVAIQDWKDGKIIREPVCCLIYTSVAVLSWIEPLQQSFFYENKTACFATHSRTDVCESGVWPAQAAYRQT